MRKTSITLQGHRTSFSLEADFLLLLRALAEERDLSLAQLVAQIDRARLSQAEPANLSSALRLFVVHAIARRQVKLERASLDQASLEHTSLEQPVSGQADAKPQDDLQDGPFAQALRQLTEPPTDLKPAK